jgi:hypothetical protein
MQTQKNGSQAKDRAGQTVVEIKAAKRTKQPEKIEIHSIEKQVIALTVVGTSELIVNNFNRKSVDEIEDNRRLSREEKLAARHAPRPPVVPEARYMGARILDEDGRDCVEARWVKAALVTASMRYKEIGLPSTQVRGALFVLGDLLPIRFKGVKPWETLLPHLDGAPKTALVPRMRRDIVRVGKPPNKQPDLRYRPGYLNWSLDLEIEFEPSLISLEALHHLVRRAGSSIGLCEWRPEKSPAGIYGRFDLEAVVKAQARARS